LHFLGLKQVLTLKNAILYGSCSKTEVFKQLYKNKE
jgi:hypothetical protein